jgi:hypothetical protein
VKWGNSTNCFITDLVLEIGGYESVDALVFDELSTDHRWRCGHGYAWVGVTSAAPFIGLDVLKD